MTAGLQPFLADRVVALSAPTQAWSGHDGDIGTAAIDGVYHGDARFLRGARLDYADADGHWHAPEPIAWSTPGAGGVRFDALLRAVDDAWPDPKVRLVRERRVTDGVVTETVTVHSHLDTPLRLGLRVRLQPDFSSLQDVKAGVAVDEASPWAVEAAADGCRVRSAGGAGLELSAPGAEVAVGDELVVAWRLQLAPRGAASVTWSVRMDDPTLVVRGARGAAPWASPVLAEALEGRDGRLRHWLRRALEDLDGLRLALPDHPDDEFFAAGAPWFFTLFGRDSLWAARLLLPLDGRMAASTLRVLARLQGRAVDPATAEQPGKIMHELRAGTLELPGESIVLPPLYYGTVDATPLWVCVLAEAAASGMPEDEVRDLLPAMEAALQWITTSAGDDGFLDYIDETGHGLSNQGWKDSGDSIQWRSGTLAQGPIALCEVQGYAYEAALGGAGLLDRFGRPGGDALREWAAGLKRRFAERFWVTTPEGRYPAVALDRDGHAVDTLTTNAGHLLGTGLLDPDEEAGVATLLTGPTMSSGFGLRTLSADAAGFWPLSYHGGSVWAHDTAIVARGMARAGLDAPARQVVDGLLAAAEAFAYRMPELHAGDAAADVPRPAPYPAACRPQAWSAAAAVTAWDILRRA
ncbi:glycogen debranching N-terminal domain-containing protein [Microbacterium sp.]|uniref:glycogen debranching N-terminal domain-containing protein n=1 Tax=Microbacterium sp. TaxID=51671 RepID=UPI0039E5651F